MLVYAALSNWALGHVDRGVAQAREAVAVSRTLGHPMSLAFAMTHAVWVLSYARLWTEALELATEAESLGAEQSLALWLAMSKAEQGVCQMHLGRLDAGLSQLATGCEAFEQTGGLFGADLGQGAHADDEFESRLHGGFDGGGVAPVELFAELLPHARHRGFREHPALEQVQVLRSHRPGDRRDDRGG